MLKAIFKDQSELEVSEVSESGCSGFVGGKRYEWDVLKTGENQWSIIDENGDSFQIVLDSCSEEEKSYMLKVDGTMVEVKAQSEFDLLLKELGISAGGVKKLKEIKAPMPGLVLDVQVQEGDVVKEGDIVLVLEAMKMENVIKATAEAEVKSIKVKKGDTIDKGSVMVTFS